ncbi:DUF6290 family protein [Lactobacillus acetotolerans]|uniref:DUF6290 family protein n=1 Tax=Lactobacillus acetotolerans TaxID=1600 RepID=UPI0007B87392|nr:DUF6290 family protein [Lactobacillus acetotolerans]QGV04223.1 hypothetical protein GJR85_01840 [Lactobacillus acetotolerans]
MATTTKSTTIRFDEDVLSLIHKQANLDGQTSTEFMRNAVLEKLADIFDYQDAVKNIRESPSQSKGR